MSRILVTNAHGRPGAPVTARMLAQGAGGLRAIGAGVRAVEADTSIDSVGRGGLANLLGEVELDAAIMDGSTFRTGAVGAVRGFAHPISIARAVMERLPHELLVGAGAERFAAEIGAEAIDNLTEDSRARWRRWFEAEVAPAARAAWPDVDLVDLCNQVIAQKKGRDTTVFLARDAAGRLCSGVSTSGWAWKYPGRLGDSPVIGAGSYADTEHGAAACTGTGEMAIRAGTSRSIVLYMKMGLSLDAAVMEAVADLRRLKGGLLARLTIHAIDRDGGHKVVANPPPAERSTYWLWRDGDPAPVEQEAERVDF